MWYVTSGASCCGRYAKWETLYPGFCGDVCFPVAIEIPGHCWEKKSKLSQLVATLSFSSNETY